MAHKEVDDLEQFYVKQCSQMREKKTAKCMCSLYGQLLSQQVLLSILIRVATARTHALTCTQTHTGCNYCHRTQGQSLCSVFASSTK